MTAATLARVRFVLEVVDLLAERDGFDPAALLDTRTGQPLGDAIERMRAALGNGVASGPPTALGTGPASAPPTGDSTCGEDRAGS